jgi:hypothetical protein
VLDLEALPSGSFSNSILGLYNYYTHDRVKESCAVHKDMGLLTLVNKIFFLPCVYKKGSSRCSSRIANT